PPAPGAPATPSACPERADGPHRRTAPAPVCRHRHAPATDQTARPAARAEWLHIPWEIHAPDAYHRAGAHAHGRRDPGAAGLRAAMQARRTAPPRPAARDLPVDATRPVRRCWYTVLHLPGAPADYP